MIWNWQQKDWPDFSYEKSVIEEFEAKFLHRQAVLSRACRNSGDEESNGFSEMMADLRNTFADPLSQEMLFAWHRLIMGGRRDVSDVGRYRFCKDAMKIVSRTIDNGRVYFEAPSSGDVPREMKRFISWFNSSSPGGRTPLPVLARAGIAHLYFVSIHPFEDGNGRLARALSEKALSQALGYPAHAVFSRMIGSEKIKYYDMLERSNKDCAITEWLAYFAETALAALIPFPEEDQGILFRESQN